MTVLQIESDPPNPRIFVDGEFYGFLSRWQQNSVALPAASRRLELRNDGYYPHRRDLKLQAGQTYTLKVHLVRKLD